MAKIAEFKDLSADDLRTKEKELDEPDYAYSWYEEPGESQTYDQDPAGATSHL